MNAIALSKVRSVSLTLSVGSLLGRQCRPAIASAISNHVRQFHATSQTSQQEIPMHHQQVLIARHLHKNNPHLLGSLSVRHPSTPFVLGWGEVDSEMDFPTEMEVDNNLDRMEHDYKGPEAVDPSNDLALSLMNRNARKPKKANHGARPCSRHTRRIKRRKLGAWRRQLRS